MASDGATYSLPFSCEYPVKPAIPIKTNTQPSRSILTIALLPHVRESSQMVFSLSLAAKRLFNSVNLQLNRFHASPWTDAEAINFIQPHLLFRRSDGDSSPPFVCGTQ